MNSFTKIFLTMVYCSHIIVFASDERSKNEVKVQQYVVEKQQAQNSAAVWAGVAGIVGAVAGTAVGYWLASSDSHTDFQPEPVYSYHIESFGSYRPESLSPKARQIKMQLDELAKYGQVFDFSDNEQAIISNLCRLGIRLYQIDNTFHSKLAQDNKVLSDAGYSIWWHGIKALEYQKEIYLSNSKKLVAYFNRHENFIRCCRIINSYASLPANPWDMYTIMIYPPVLPDWIACQCVRNTQYPLIAYKEKIENDRHALIRLGTAGVQATSAYPIIFERAKTVVHILDHVLTILCASGEYQREVDRKRHDELVAERYRIEQEMLEVTRQQARIAEEANRLAAQRAKIEQAWNQNYRDDKY